MSTDEIIDSLKLANDTIKRLDSDNGRLRDENRELTAWKESMMTLWSPVIDYCQQHGDELGIKLGESISEYVLTSLKKGSSAGRLKDEVLCLCDSTVFQKDFPQARIQILNLINALDKNV